MTARAVKLADLRRAAAIAGETGQVVAVEAPNGTVFRIAPPGVSLPIGSEKEVAACDKAFGLSG